MQQAGTHRSKLPQHYARAIQESATGKRRTSVEDGNSTDETDNARNTIAALSTAERKAKSEGPGFMDSARGDGSPKDKKHARLENVDHAYGKRRKDSPR